MDTSANCNGVLKFLIEVKFILTFGNYKSMNLFQLMANGANGQSGKVAKKFTKEAGRW